MTWYYSSSYTPSGGPIAASASPGSIGNGYVDVGGNRWNVTSSNVLTSPTDATSSFNASLLLNTASINNVVDSQVKVRFTFVANEAVSLTSRATTAGGNTTGYLAILNSGTNAVGFFTVTAGTPTSIFIGTTPGTTLTPGQQYDLTFTTTQTDSTHTALTLTVADTSGNVINTGTFSDTTLAFQNRSGGHGLFIAAQSSGNSPGAVNSIISYGDVNNSPTSYILTLPNSTNTGQTISGTVQPVGGANMTSSLSVTLSDASGGTFSPNPVVVPSGTASVSFTYTPATAGTKTVSYTHTGGNSGMSGDGSQTVNVASTFGLGTNSPCCVLSPYNWSTGSGGAGTSQTLNPGAYARFYIKNCTAANILTDPAANGNQIFTWSIDNGPLSSQITCPSSGSTAITIPDTGSHVVNVFFSGFTQAAFFNAGRWARTLYFGLVGLQVASPTGGTDTATKFAKNMLLFGDSITEGYHANNGNQGNEYAYSYYIGQAYWNLGYEYGIVGTGSQGYTATGAGGVVPLYTPGNDAQSAWNKVDVSNSRLVNGLLSPQPNLILDNHGVNDFAATQSQLVASIVGLYSALRSAAPNAVMIKIMPYSLANSMYANIRPYVNIAMSTYQNLSTGDANQSLIDINFDARMNGGTYSNVSGGDPVHPNVWGHANIATTLLPRIANTPGIAGGSGTKYPASTPIGSVASGSVSAIVPWAIPAKGQAGATGSVQTGATTFVSPAAGGANRELCNLLDRMVSDGRAVIS